MSTLKGVQPVVHLAFHDNYEIDFDVLAAELDYAYSCGAQGIVLALASELLRLTENERYQLAEFLVSSNDGRGDVTISVGAESTFQAVKYAQHAESVGATALMAIPPLATGLGEEEARRYYSALLDAVNIPVVVQDASAYVGRPMTAAFQASLWRDYGARVLFKPESAPVGPVISALNELTSNGAGILEGSGGSGLVENYRRGISGTMPGCDLLDAIVALWRALEAGDEERIYTISPLVGSILALAVGLDGYIAVEKHLMHRRGIFKNTLRRGPHGFSLDEPTTREIDRLFNRLLRVLET